MIWASDAAGRTTYMSPQWEVLTGQSAQAAKPHGWIEQVHVEDRASIERTYRCAIDAQREFWGTYRLRRHDGTYLWVVDGATPCFGQVHGEFLGFLGSITEIDAPAAGRAEGQLGAFRPPPVRESTRPLAPVDMIADLAIVGRLIARDADETEIAALFDDVLREIGLRLGARGSGQQDGPATSH